MKILILRLSSFGDVVLTSPITRAVKKQIPHVEIHYLIKSQFKEAIEENPYITKIHFFNNYKECIKELKKEKFNCILDLHNNLRSKVIASRLKGKYYTFDKLNFKKWLLVNFKINLLPEIHLVDRYFNAVKSLNIKNDYKGLDFFIHPENEMNKPFENYTAVCISAKHATKKLPESKLIKLVHQIKGKIVLLGGKEDRTTATGIVENNAQIVSFVGETNLQQTASLIQKADKVICYDTAMMHIAAAFQKNMVTIWGNTVPQFGMFPYLIKNGKLISNKNQHRLENKQLNCRPCSKIGHKKCPKNHFNCMNNLNFEKL